MHVMMEKSHVRNLAYHLLPGVVTDMIQPPNKIYTFLLVMLYAEKYAGMSYMARHASDLALTGRFPHGWYSSRVDMAGSMGNVTGLDELLDVFDGKGRCCSFMSLKSFVKGFVNLDIQR